MSILHQRTNTKGPSKVTNTYPPLECMHSVGNYKPKVDLGLAIRRFQLQRHLAMYSLPEQTVHHTDSGFINAGRALIFFTVRQFSFTFLKIGLCKLPIESGSDLQGNQLASISPTAKKFFLH